MFKLKINVISAEDTQHKITNYSKSLFKELNKYNYLDLAIRPIKKPETKNPLYFIKLLSSIKKYEITHIQYQNSCFGLVPIFYSLINYFPLIIYILKSRKKNTIITTVHEFDPNSQLDRSSFKFLNLSDKIIVHDEKTMNSLQKMGIPTYKLVRIVHDTFDPEILENNEFKQKINHLKSEKSSNDNNWEKIAEKSVNEYLKILEIICGHPDEIYEDKKQKERINWLKNNKIGKTLEIGCSTGFVTNYLEADVGVDLREDRILLANINYPNIQFIKCDASNLPFADNYFDTVLIPDILEHVPFEIAKKILCESYRVSKTKLLITIPNGSREGWENDPEVGGKNPEHVWAPTKERMNELTDEYNKDIKLSKDDIFWLIEVKKNSISI